MVLLPVFAIGQTAQETVDRKLNHAAQQFSTNSEIDAVVATPYTKNYAGIAGSPFWATEVWSRAEVMYKGRLHPVNELKYDCANDLMVIPQYTEEGVRFMNLIPIFYPDIFITMKRAGNRRGKEAKDIPTTREHFIFYPATEQEKSEGVVTGYYHYLIEKNQSLLGKYTSRIEERNGAKSFVEEVKYFMQNDGRLQRVRRVNSFLEAFPQWSDKIAAYVEDNRISTLATLGYEDIEKLVEYVNVLSKP